MKTNGLGLTYEQWKETANAMAVDMNGECGVDELPASLCESAFEDSLCPRSFAAEVMADAGRGSR